MAWNPVKTAQETVGGTIDAAKKGDILGVGRSMFSPVTQFFDQASKGFKSGGGGGGGGASYGTDLPTPILQSYRGLETLGGAGKLGASTVDASPWMNLAMNQQKLEEGGALEKAVAGQQQALAQGRANLAMRGGLSGGAAERMAMQGANDLANARQNVFAQGAINRGNIALSNVDKRSEIDKFNAQMTQDANRFNTSAAIQDLAAQNARNQFQYGEEMKMKGAAMSGQAIENSGKK